MAQIDSIAGGIEDDLMHPDHVALAEGDNFQFLAARVAHDLLESNRRPRGSIFFLCVVALEDLSIVIVFQRGPGGGNDLEKQVHTDGKIWSVEEPGFCGLDQFPQARVPTSLPDQVRYSPRLLT